MTNYYRVSAGRSGQYLEEAIVGGWVGTGWLAGYDLTNKFPDNWRDFNSKWVSVISDEENTSRIAAGLGAGMTWTVCKNMQKGDIVLVPTGLSTYRVARVSGDYVYAPGHPLAHRRPVVWLEREISRDELSDDLKRPLKSAGTVVSLGKVPELDALLASETIIATPETIESDQENPLSFVLEKHLEDFMVSNWLHTELGKEYDIATDETGALVGRQYQTDTGPIDILAKHKTKNEYLVIELKRGRVSDVVVGQILRYMGFVRDLDSSAEVRGIIIGTDDDNRFRRAISMVPSLDFYKYEVTFKLAMA